MFTGIVKALGTVDRIQPVGKAARLLIRHDDIAAKATVGDSISVNGCCLTVVHAADGAVGFDTVPETLDKTNELRRKAEKLLRELELALRRNFLNLKDPALVLPTFEPRFKSLYDDMDALIREDPKTREYLTKLRSATEKEREAMISSAQDAHRDRGVECASRAETRSDARIVCVERVQHVADGPARCLDRRLSAGQVAHEGGDPDHCHGD